MAKKPAPEHQGAVRPLTDEEKIAQFLARKGPTRCDPLPQLDDCPRRSTGSRGMILPIDNSVPEELRRLARVKIAMAFIMIQQRYNTETWKIERLKAELWLTGGSGEFERWCHLAGLPVALVKRKAEEVVRERELSLKLGYTPMNGRKNSIGRTLEMIAKRYKLKDLVDG